MSFRLKTILGIAIIEGALLLLLIWLGLNLIEKSQVEALQKRAQTIATLFATIIKDPVLSSDLASIESFSAEVMKNPGMLYARVIDSHELLLSHQGNYELAQSLSGADHFQATYDIVVAGESYGRVEIALGDQGREEWLQLARSNAIVLAALEMTLVALFSFILGLWLTRQIRALEIGARRISQGDFGYQLPVKGKDELARTTQAFNSMSEQLERLYSELSQVNEELESRVAERSQELQLIYRVSAVMVDLQKPLEQLFHDILQAINESQFGRIKIATRIVFDDEIYALEAFATTQLMARSTIVVDAKPRGVIEMVCQRHKSGCSMERFLSDKQPLVHALSQNLGTMIEHRISVQERETMQAQIRQGQKMESIGLLASGIAHEINTPTQFVNDNMHFLQDANQELWQLLQQYQKLREQLPDDSALAEAANALRQREKAIDLEFLQSETPLAYQQSLDGLQRISSIVKSMKEFAHPGSHKKVNLDIREQIDTTINVSRNEWKYCAEVSTDYDEDLPFVPILPDEFKQVILNLLVNAAHAIEASGRKPGEIRIQTRREGDFAVVRVRDNGCGIAASIQNRVMEPFFTTKEPGKGTGQGLAIAYSIIVDKHQGDLKLKSREGEGAEFEIRLPLDPELEAK